MCIYFFSNPHKPTQTIININTICKCSPTPPELYYIWPLHKLMSLTRGFPLLLFFHDMHSTTNSRRAGFLALYSIRVRRTLHRNTSASCPWCETVWPSARKKVSETSIWQSYLSFSCMRRGKIVGFGRFFFYGVFCLDFWRSDRNGINRQVFVIPLSVPFFSIGFDICSSVCDVCFLSSDFMCNCLLVLFG